MSFTLAVNGIGKDSEATFVNIVAWEQKAEYISSYQRKGSRLLVEGRIQTRKYEAQDGSKRTVVEVVAEQVTGIDKSDTQTAPVTSEYAEDPFNQE